MNLSNVLKYLCLGVISIAIIGQYNGARAESNAYQRDYVYTVCNEARITLDSAKRVQCGQAQDKTHTEFLCSSDDMSPSTHCWVETL